MRVAPITLTQPITKQKQQHPKPTDRPTFQEWLLLALANGKERKE
jgi:hypothetical protein